MLPACTFVIFGATGDLTKRKLIPALYKMHLEGKLHPKTRILAIGRRDYTAEGIAAEFEGFIKEKKGWNPFCKRVSYFKLEFRDGKAYDRLAKILARMERNRIFYLATAPDAFTPIIGNLHRAGIAKKGLKSGFHRIVFEKPFGHDRKSAESLNDKIMMLFDERQTYRIDHYLGKELVQNVLVMRFTNPLFEHQWDARHIDNVQIISVEDEGVLDRGGYYDGAGALRDMVQNHLLQILSLVAMEAPASLDANDIRDEKVKALRNIIITPDIRKDIVLGQYAAGIAGGKRTPDYRKEKGVNPKSDTETFAALKLQLHNKRWHGVPFYLRTGKALSHKYAEVVVTFKQAPCTLFCGANGKLAENKLFIRIQPDEGIKVQFNLKERNAETALPRSMDFSERSEFGMNTQEAYERLLADVMRGDQTLFTRWDEVDQAWRIVDALRAAKPNLHKYKAGTHGPAAALRLLKRDGRDWSGNHAVHD